MGRHAARNNCPFCGHWASDVRPVGGYYSNAGIYRARCCGCGAEGPKAEGKREAARLWNNRAEFLDRHGNPAPRVPIDFETTPSRR